MSSLNNYLTRFGNNCQFLSVKYTSVNVIQKHSKDVNNVRELFSIYSNVFKA